MRQGTTAKVCPDLAKSARFTVPVLSTAGLIALARIGHDLPLPEPVKGTILAPKPRESGECWFKRNAQPGFPSFRQKRGKLGRRIALQLARNKAKYALKGDWLRSWETLDRREWIGLYGGNMVEYKQDVVIVHDTAEDVRAFVRDLDERLKDLTLSDDQVTQITEVLRNLANHPFNQSDGEVRSLISRYQFPLRRSLYTAFGICLTFSGGLVALLGDPVTGGSLALAGTTVVAAQRAGDLLTKLTPDEIIIYQGLGAVLREKRTAGQEERATTAEVQAYFDKRREDVGDVAPVLSNLRVKGAIGSDVVSGQLQYKIAA
jgi:hypothetical protein